MTRGRAIWLLLLAVGLALGLLLRAPRRPRSVAADAARPVTSARARGDELVEVEVVDPNELDASVPARTPGEPENATEKDYLEVLSAIWKGEPARALTLVEEGERRFGESPRAVERRLYEIKALVELGRIGSARTKAERYLARYPQGPMTDEVERLTGVHRRPPLEP
jgi:hypothetical protein